jgi:hypothetical protein
VPRPDLQERLRHVVRGSRDPLDLRPPVVPTRSDEIDLVVAVDAVVADDEVARSGLDRLVATGSRDDAQPHLARALQLFRSMGANLFVGEAERLLAASA